MYSIILNTLKSDPELYASSEYAFWDDDHISKGMLANHISPTSDGATRRFEEVMRSAEWISSYFSSGDRLLDLGCGPGIYAELFTEKGCEVCGIDISRRSIDYAKQSATSKGFAIDYRCQNYLDMDFSNEFDIVTLIYCDFGVLPIEDQKLLLEKIYAALKPGGYFIMDVFSRQQYADWSDQIEISYEEGGFWSEEPYVCIKKSKRYDRDYFLEQYLVITEDDCRIYNLWNHAYTFSELKNALFSAGLVDQGFYADVAGGQGEDSSTICVVSRKPME